MIEYGLTEKGFISKPFSVILQEEKDAWKAAFGYEIDASTGTPEGAYIGVQVAKLTQLWEMMGGLFAAGDPDTASGIYLDRLVSLVNVKRKSADSTRVYAALWGEEETSINSGHLAKMSVSGDHFALQEPVTINRNSLLGFQFKISELDIGLYSLAIDGRVISFTATEDDTEETVAVGIIDQIDGIFPGVFEVVNHGDNGIEIHSKAGIVPFVLFCDDPKIEVVSLAALGIYRAVVPGALFAGIGTLDKIISNVSGLDRIINYATGITGREKESDTELRIEKNNRQRQASSNEVAIKNEIKKLPGVQFCEVYSNRSHESNNGRPPNCYEAIVIGGMDKEIAEAIFNKGPGGIQPFGNTIVTVKDTENMPWDIGFSRPENKYIWIKIVIEKNPEEDFPANGIELIKKNIDAWGAANLEVGIDLIFQKLNKPIYSVPGISLADIKVAVTDDLTPPEEEDYAAQNLGINERQIALVDKTRVIIAERQ
jgi:uncharacterized phage protein gp47/JayE